VSENPLVTIVIPTWNRLALVEEAVKSVMAQTYTHWELIVVDDGSTDGTAEHLHALGEGRLRVLSLPHAGNLGYLRNCGVAAGSGELIAFLDSDDVWLPPKLETQVRALAESGAGWGYCGYDMMDASGQAVPRAVGQFRALSGRIIREVLTYQVTAPLTALIVRRTLFDAVGRFSEDPRLVAREDQELNLRLALHADAVAVPDMLARMRQHSGRTTAELSDPHERSARVYEVFLAGKPPAELAKLARRYWTRELINAGRHKLAAGRLVPAARLFGLSLVRGAELPRWGGALVRGLSDWLRSGHTARNRR
jgi:glycosyltransferase involved in cell wall biosynthesis